MALGSDRAGSAGATADPERWLEDHGDCLFGYAMLRVRREHVAEDLVQETLLAALRAQQRFEGRSTERSWLVGILKNKVIDYFRKLGREQSFTDLEFFGHEDAERFDGESHWIIARGPVEWPGADGGTLDREQFWQTLQECLGKLPARVSDVFLLREVDDLPTDEICAMLGLSPNNLWVMLHRARMALRGCLEIHWFGDPRKGGMA